MIHFIYRSYGGENRKIRPSYYSKQLALVSFLRAAANLAEPHEIIYLNDGPIPADRAEIMARTGEVIACQNRRLAGSLSDALDLPIKRNWPDEDLVWFAEDDYLYLPDALTALAEAARRFPEADYFALYAAFGRRMPFETPSGNLDFVPRAWHDTEPVLIEGHPWRRAMSTTSTFGGRSRSLRADRFQMEVAMQTGGAFDHTTCLMSQGFQPFRWGAIIKPHDPSLTFNLRQKLRNGALRSAVNIWQLGRKLLGRRPRLWMAPEPALCTHMETEYLAAGRDWAAVASACRDWAVASGLIAPAMQTSAQIAHPDEHGSELLTSNEHPARLERAG